MLCFQGRCYPAGEAASSTEIRRGKQSFLNEDQKADLKKKMAERYTKQFGRENTEQVRAELEAFFATGADINSTSIFFLESRLKKQFGEAKSKQADRKPAVSQPHTSQSQERPQTIPQAELTPRQDIAESKVLSATEAQRLNNVSKSEADFKLPSLNKQQLMEMQHINWKNDEEKWGTIYKYNAYVDKQEKRLEKLRAQHKMQAVRNHLEEQVREKERERQREKEMQVSFHSRDTELKQIQKANDDRKKDHLKAKIEFQREMRQRQMDDNRLKRESEEQAEKLRQELAIQKIKEELAQDKAEQNDLKQKKLEEMRRVMAENEERKIIMAREKERERLEDVDLQRRATDQAIELDRQRQAEIKAKADRLTNILKRYPQLTSSQETVNSMKQQKTDNEHKNRRYQDLKDRILEEKERKDKQLEAVRKNQLRDFLMKQVRLASAGRREAPARSRVHPRHPRPRPHLEERNRPVQSLRRQEEEREGGQPRAVPRRPQPPDR